MKFEITPSFTADVKRLKREHLDEFRRVVREKFVPACDAFAADPAVGWPASLRVKAMRSAPGIMEMTWSFASPDGRATFEFVTVDDEPRVRWRRVGDHRVFTAP